MNKKKKRKEIQDILNTAVQYTTVENYAMDCLLNILQDSYVLTQKSCMLLIAIEMKTL